jgi:hypothetical protein
MEIQKYVLIDKLCQFMEGNSRIKKNQIVFFQTLIDLLIGSVLV